MHISRPIAVSKAENDVFWTEDEIKFYFERNIKQTLTYLSKIGAPPSFGATANASTYASKCCHTAHQNEG